MRFTLELRIYDGVYIRVTIGFTVCTFKSYVMVYITVTIEFTSELQCGLVHQTYDLSTSELQMGLHQN